MNLIASIKALWDKSNRKKKRDIVLLSAVIAFFLILCIVTGIVSASSNGRVFPVYMTEILASNTRYPNEDGRCADFIELYNSADYAVDLSNFELGDIGGNQRYVFPSGSIIGPGEYLVVYCDKTVTEGNYAHFGISRAGGEAIYLLASNNAVIDSVVTVATELDQSMVLLENNEWGLSDMVTPGRANDETSQGGQVVYNPGVSSVRINELMSANAGYPSTEGLFYDWVELHNTSDSSVDISGYTLSDDVGNDKYAFPAGTVIPADGYLVIYCSDAVRNDGIAPFGISQLGDESVVLKNSEKRIVEIVECAAMSENEALALDSSGVWTVTVQGTPGFANTEEGYAAFKKAVGMDARPVVISELMAASQAVLPDCFGEFNDWVELYNTTGETIDLTGWFLSDDPAEPTKWQFPEGTIQPGGRIVVYCSGEDGVYEGELHTSFSLSASAETVVLTTNMAVVSDSVSYTKAQENCSLVFEDGTAEPLSCGRPTPGYPNDENGYEQFCASQVAAGPLAIWEVMTSNDWYLPQTLGECYDWVELRNISDSSVNLSDYSITDDPDAQQMYVLPDKTLAPGECIAIILSGDESLSTRQYSHAGFTLNAAEDQLFLYDNSGKLLDHVFLKDIPLGYSYGRSTSSGGFFYMEPTPKNNNASGSRMISAMPTSDIEPGVYALSEGVDVSFNAEGTIYYTTDGSDPDTGSNRYSGPIQIDETTVLRAVAVEDGKLSSDIYTSTFIVQQNHDIPIVSLVTDPDNLWSAEKGIYKNNDLEIKEEKRAANLAYVGEDGTFSIECEISLHGNMTAQYFPKKSFTVRFQDNYAGPLEYDVFGDGDVTRFSSLILRAAYESTYSSNMRDAMMGYVASYNSDTVVAQKYKFVAFYLNGEYWGLYAIREHHSVEHYATYMDVPASSVTMVKPYIENRSNLYQLFKYAQKNSFASDASYEYAKTFIDVDSFIDWIIFESYTGNIDIYENMRYYYCSVDGLWRCGLVDVDLGFFSQDAVESVVDAFHHGVIVKALFKNKEFQHKFATRLAELLSGPMSDENMLALIDKMAAEIRSEIPMDRARWGSTAYQWEKMVNELRDYCDGRTDQMIRSFSAYMGFTASEKEAYFGDLI